VYERCTTIRNKEGLHFRPAMKLVDAAQRFAAALTVSADGRAADARSPMELVMLMATSGTSVRVAGDGPDENAAVDVLVEIIEAGFGETLT
jgi:phosphocarrier protein HPr